MRALSERQRRMLEFIREFIRRHGYPPSIRDIGRAVGISSTSVVDYNLRVLEREGYLRRARDVSRGLELLVEVDEPRPARVVEVPVVGRIAAGEPIEALAEHTETLPLGPEIATEGCYALQVKGKSMIEDLIDDGDYVVIRPQETANNGDIVVALLLDSAAPEGVATLKRLYRERDRIRLQPANSSMQPIYVDPACLRIQGKVIAVIRQLA
ncbi:MAG TPA: transcriptional repressor LexA [Chloroflexota bacterium]|nr:transcriptional repressor LexA [Chloroflexota bacterium]